MIASLASYSTIYLCFPVGKQIGVRSCRATWGHRKSTIFSSVVHGSAVLLYEPLLYGHLQKFCIFSFCLLCVVAASSDASSTGSVFVEDGAQGLRSDWYPSVFSGPKAVDRALTTSAGGIFVADEEYDMSIHREFSLPRSSVKRTPHFLNCEFRRFLDLVCLDGEDASSHPWLDLGSFLTSLGLAHYLPVLQEQEIDLAVFLTMSDQDFREVGVT